jgi:hypothetical protein
MNLAEVTEQRDKLRGLVVRMVNGRFLDDARRAQTNPHRQQDILSVITAAEVLLAQLEVTR